MLFLGIDPSLTGTGLVVINENREIVDQKLISTDPVGPWDGETKRVQAMGLSMWNCIEAIEDQLTICMEGYSYASGQRAHTMGALGHEYRVSLLDAQRALDADVFIIPPATLKKFVTGNGRASKLLVCTNLSAEFGAIFDNDNLYDALGLALISLAIYHLKNPDRQSGFTKEQLKTIRKYAEQE